MKKYFQGKDNDCLTAVLATMFQIDPAGIPFFFETKDPQANYEKWLFDMFGISIIAFDYDKGRPRIPKVYNKKYYCIGTLKHEAKKYSHAVVLCCDYTKEGTVVHIAHDPMADTCYSIDDLIGIEFLVGFKDELNKG